MRKINFALKRELNMVYIENCDEEIFYKHAKTIF